MVGRRLLLIGSGVTLLAGLIMYPTAAFACSASTIAAGMCESGGSTGDGSVDLWAQLGSARSADAEPGDLFPPNEEQALFDQRADLTPTPAVPPENCSPINFALCFGPHDEDEEPEPQPDAPAVVTLRDIASFRPAAPGNGMEPGGWAVEGLPANFVAEASVQVVSGTLLGQPADVRFTPVGYRWVHSDGGAVESAGPGASWESLGQREFSETATSHTYTAAGEYTVELSVALRAEYRFAGSGWRDIAGTLTVTGEPRRVLVGEFDTVLTNGDCLANPSGPGC